MSCKKNSNVWNIEHDILTRSTSLAFTGNMFMNGFSLLRPQPPLRVPIVPNIAAMGGWKGVFEPVALLGGEWLWVRPMMMKTYLITLKFETKIEFSTHGDARSWCWHRCITGKKTMSAVIHVCVKNYYSIAVTGFSPPSRPVMVNLLGSQTFT